MPGVQRYVVGNNDVHANADGFSDQPEWGMLVSLNRAIKHVRLAGEQVFVGSGSLCHYQIECFPSLEDTHICLERVNDCVFLTDLSQGSVAVNGMKVDARVPLAHGDEVLLTEYLAFVFTLSEINPEHDIGKLLARIAELEKELAKTSKDEDDAVTSEGDPSSRKGDADPSSRKGDAPPLPPAPGAPPPVPATPPPVPPPPGPPPPPPPPGGAGPPPPPPPPGGAGPPPPPPPPGGGPPPPPGAPTGGPSKKKVKPRVPMKGIFWDKLHPTAISGTVWEKVDDQKVPLNLAEFEQEFAKEQKKKKKKEKANKEEKPVEVSICDPKRVNNVSIMLKRYKILPRVIKAAIYDMDKHVLSPDLVRALVIAAPTPEEISMIENYTGNKTRLGPVEQFFMEMMTIPYLTMRLESMSTKHRFHSLAGDVEDSLETLTKACQQVRDCAKLVKVLEVVLAFGNYLNGGTNRGQACGFKLSSLMKLKDLRGGETAPTLLHYLVIFLRSSPGYDSCVDFYRELSVCESAAVISLEDLGSNLRSLKMQVKGIADAVENVESVKEKKKEKDMFVPGMKPFLNFSRLKIDEMDENMQKFEENFANILTFFGLKSTTQPEEVFGVIGTFSRQFEAAILDLKRKEEMQRKMTMKMEKDAARRAKAAKLLRDKEAKKKAAEAEEEDELLGALQRTQTIMKPARERRKTRKERKKEQEGGTEKGEEGEE